MDGSILATTLHLGDPDNLTGDADKSKTKKKSEKLSPWKKLGLKSERVLQTVQKVGFRLPTPIQRRMIPAILRNEGDVVAMSRTGSGKTAAFLLPMIERLDEHCKTVGARALIISPTRELSIQTGAVCKKFCCFTDLRLCFLTGGMSIEKQFEHLANNPDILIASPGRLCQHMVETNYTLTRVQMAVFDEADLLFDMGFEEQLNTIITALKLSTKQLILTSATLPTRLVEFAKLKLSNPSFIQLDLDKQLSEKLDMDFFYCRETDKLAAFIFWITRVKLPKEQVIVFCSTKHHCHFLQELLTHLRIPCAIVAGDGDQQQRNESLAAFRAGEMSVLLATDVAARGVDIQQLRYVFHFDFPQSARLFVHRSGRTARNNESGSSVALVTRPDIPLLQELMLFLGRKFKIPAVTKDTSPEVKAETKGDLKVLELDLEGSSECILGGFPDLDDERAAVDDAIKENAELPRLYSSMMAGHSCYLKFRSKEFSQMSMHRSGELLNAYGGPQTLAESVHPKLRALQALNIRNEDTKIFQKLGHSAAEILGDRDVTAAADAKVAKDEEKVVDLRTIRSFRPSVSTSAARGIGIDLGTMRTMKRSVDGKQLVRRMAREGLDVGEQGQEQIDEIAHLSENEDLSEPETGDTQSCRKRYMSRAARKRKKSGGEAEQSPVSKKVKVSETEGRDFYTSSTQDEHVHTRDSELNSINQMQKQTMDLLPDDESKFKSVQHVMKWNSKKKRYEVTPVNKKGVRMKVKNSSGTVVRGEVENKGLYKRWVRHSDKRIQKVGEEEEVGNLVQKRVGRRDGADVNVDPTPLEDLTKDLGLIEKVKLKRKLTHREERKLARLTKLSQNPVTREGDRAEQEVRSAKELRSNARRALKNKARHDVKYRQSEAKKSKDKFMAKRRQQAAARGAKTRSLVITRHSSKR